MREKLITLFMREKMINSFQGEQTQKSIDGLFSLRIGVPRLKEMVISNLVEEFNKLN